MTGRTAWTVAGILATAAIAAEAGDVELGVFVGRSIPTYEQSFSYDPGRFLPPTPAPVPSLTVAQEGTFGLTARGGLAAGASLALYVADAVAFEARIDTVDLSVDATGVRYTATLSSAVLPIPPVTATLDLPPGEVDVARLTPFSLGLKLRTPGRARFYLSAGVSYLPRLEATASQSLAVGLTRITPSIEVIEAGVRASADPAEGAGRWGVTGALGLQVRLGDNASLLAEARAFRFPERILTWELARPTDVPLVDGLLRDAIARLEPIELSPTFYQATAGIAFRF
jgi:hypothetical protein